MSRPPRQSDSVVTIKNIFHVAMLALAMTGLFMSFSAEDLGSAGPVIISMGISFVFYALISEALLGLLFLIKIIAARVSPDKPVQEVG
jgi:hypothetical protein